MQCISDYSSTRSVVCLWGSGYASVCVELEMSDMIFRYFSEYCEYYRGYNIANTENLGGREKK